MMDEHQQNRKEMTNTVIKINKKTEEMFNTIHAIDQVRNYFETILK